MTQMTQALDGGALRAHRLVRSSGDRGRAPGLQACGLAAASWRARFDGGEGPAVTGQNYGWLRKKFFIFYKKHLALSPPA
jgi:hypothetical protein